MTSQTNLPNPTNHVEEVSHSGIKGVDVGSLSVGAYRSDSDAIDVDELSEESYRSGSDAVDIDSLSKGSCRSDSDTIDVDSLTGEIPYGLTNDYMFKAFFQVTLDTEIPKRMLASLLKIDYSSITDIRIENPILLGEQADSKKCILDIHLIINNSISIDLEMQVWPQDFWIDRSLTYLCRQFDTLSKGKDYDQSIPCIQIGILDFTLFKDQPEFYAKYSLLNERTYKKYSDKLNIIVLELNSTEYATPEDIDSGLVYWSKLFKAHTWEELKKLCGEEKYMSDCVVHFAELTADDRIRLQCEAREKYEKDMRAYIKTGINRGIEQGIQQGIEQGIEKGIEQEKVNTEAEKARADNAEAEVSRLRALLESHGIKA